MFSEMPLNRNTNGTIRRGSRFGWVLTGGRSSRMGIDKALIEIDGRPLALRVADELAKVCDGVALVGDPERYSHLGLPVIPDSFPGQGPLAGIEAALAASHSEANLILACDMPALDPAVVEQLFSAHSDCAVPQYPDGKTEPLCSVFSRRCHPVIREALETGVRKVTDCHRLLETRGFALSYVPVENISHFENLNTPEDLLRFRLRFRDRFRRLPERGQHG
jgi:molybdopterin-guanine dinucleotide biosynthesis protein A